MINLVLSVISIITILVELLEMIWGHVSSFAGLTFACHFVCIIKIYVFHIIKVLRDLCLILVGPEEGRASKKGWARRLKISKYESLPKLKRRIQKILFLGGTRGN